MLLVSFLHALLTPDCGVYLFGADTPWCFQNPSAPPGPTQRNNEASTWESAVEADLSQLNSQKRDISTLNIERSAMRSLQFRWCFPLPFSPTIYMLFRHCAVMHNPRLPLPFSGTCPILLVASPLQYGFAASGRGHVYSIHHYPGPACPVRY